MAEIVTRYLSLKFISRSLLWLGSNIVAFHSGGQSLIPDIILIYALFVIAISLFIHLCLVYIHTNITNYCLRSDIHNRYTRNNSILNIPKCRLASTSETCFYNGVNFYNKLPLKGRTIIELNIFKKGIYNWLLMRPFYSINEFFNILILMLIFKYRTVKLTMSYLM